MATFRNWLLVIIASIACRNEKMTPVFELATCHHCIHCLQKRKMTTVFELATGHHCSHRLHKRENGDCFQIRYRPSLQPLPTETRK
ncbi:hypothetical protein CEXT_677591 [Caerostris extrusa]|uniref:Secreted protein n=1 Tax=Caerostris extrusa TaxID=172846 RepID=A0AAV4NF61_CAEEX|nr:hypothetical protein CEXT_677591 [Caerostris extrusa]